MMIVAALILSLAPAPAPQTASAGAGTAGGLEVSSFYWGRIEAHDVDMSAPFPRSAAVSRRRRGYNPDVVHLIQRETYALVRNAGPRKIKAVTWDYVFFEDAKRERELKRFTFRTKEAIAPGEMKFLASTVEEGPPSSFGDVVIQRVEFDDGTSWQREGARR